MRFVACEGTESPISLGNISNSVLILHPALFFTKVQIFLLNESFIGRKGDEKDKEYLKLRISLTFQVLF